MVPLLFFRVSFLFCFLFRQSVWRECSHILFFWTQCLFLLLFFVVLKSFIWYFVFVSMISLTGVFTHTTILDPMSVSFAVLLFLDDLFFPFLFCHLFFLIWYFSFVFCIFVFCFDIQLMGEFTHTTFLDPKFYCLLFLNIFVWSIFLCRSSFSVFFLMFSIKSYYYYYYFGDVLLCFCFPLVSMQLHLPLLFLRFHLLLFLVLVPIQLSFLLLCLYLIYFIIFQRIYFKLIYYY